MSKIGRHRDKRKGTSPMPGRVSIFLDIKPVVHMVEVADQPDIQKEGGTVVHLVQVSETRYGIVATGATREEALEAFWQSFFGLEDMLDQVLAGNWDGWDDARASVFSELRAMLDKSDEPLREAMLTELAACLQYIREVKTWELAWRIARKAQEDARQERAALALAAATAEGTEAA